jgi:hypothetical protein
MPKHRTFGGYARDEDGKQTRTVYSPGGNTHVGTQIFSTTPTGNNQAWLFNRHDEEARRQDDLQSIRDSRKRNNRGIEMGKRARVPLAFRAESLGVRSAEGMKPKALSRKVLRAEMSAEERDARNATEIDRQKDCRAEQSVDVRGALNAARRAHDKVRRAEQPPQDRDANAARKQVTRSMRWHCAPCTPVRLVFGVFPTNPY